jgi:uncharacterized protein involved in exopolysaccharide biosynthesis
MAIAMGVGLGLTLAYTAIAPREFGSDSKLFVRVGRESVALDPTATTGQYVALTDTRSSEVFAIEELFKSRVLAEKIVDEFGPYVILQRDPESRSLGQRLAWLDRANLNPLRTYSLRDKAIEAFARNLRVSSGTKTSIISLSYSCGDPLMAQRVLDALLRFANDEHLRMHRTKGSQEFFVKQTGLLEQNLARLEVQLRDLKNSTAISSLATQREIKLQLIGSLDGDLIRARAEEDGLKAELLCRRQQLQDTPNMSVAEETTGQPNATDQSLRTKLYDLEIREKELAAQYAPEHPLRVELQKQLDGVKQLYQDAQVSVQVKLGLNPAHQSAQLAVDERESLLAGTSSKAQSLDAKIASFQQDMKQLNDNEVVVNRLEREIDLARTNWHSYAANLEEARINQQLEEAKISSLNVMQPPTFSETPISPRPIPTLALGFVGSVMLSIGVGLLAYRRQRSLRGLPVMIVPQEMGSPLPESLAAAFARRGEVASAKS